MLKRSFVSAIVFVALTCANAVDAHFPLPLATAAAAGERAQRPAAPRPAPGVAQALTPPAVAQALPAATGSPAPPGPPAQPPILPGSLSGASPPALIPDALTSPSPVASRAPASPLPSPTSPDRFHLHRPGTDVDGDQLSGNALSDIYVFRGNVVLRSDPKVDRAIGAATESTDPITVTADEVDVDRTGMTYVAKGHVHFVQGSRSGNSDLATLDDAARTLDLLGNADVREGERRARAAKMHYDIAGRHFHAAGDVRIYQPVPSPNPQASSTPPPKRKRRLPF